jgi:hypothetical protein
MDGPNQDGQIQLKTGNEPAWIYNELKMNTTVAKLVKLPWSLGYL